jgi:hypothetical protein
LLFEESLLGVWATERATWAARTLAAAAAAALDLPAELDRFTFICDEAVG